MQAVALTPMRHEHRKGSKQPLNDECWYCQRKGHFKRDCVALKGTQRNTAELAFIARRHRGRRRGDTTLTRRTVVAEDMDSALLKQRQSFRESFSEARQQTFAKQRAMLLAEHATAMLARERHRRTGRGAGGQLPPPPIRAVCRHEFGQRVDIIRAKPKTCLNNTN